MPKTKQTATKSKPAKESAAESERISAVELASSATPAQAFQHLITQLRSHPPENVQSCRADPKILFSNTRLALTSLTPYLDHDLREHLPKVSAAVIKRTLPHARALIHAAGLVGRTSQADVEKAFAELRPLRANALFAARLLANTGKLPEKRVRNIEAGNGRFDEAADGVALAALFTEFERKIAGQHPITAENVADLARLGNFLLDRITPSGARKAADEEHDAATRDRDLIYSQLLEDYRSVRKAGAYFFEDRVDELVPALHSYVGAARGGEEPPAGGAAGGGGGGGATGA